MSMGPREWALLGVLAALWGGSFFFAKIAVTEFAPPALALCRVGLAALALHIVRWTRGTPMPGDAGTWAAFALMGLLNNVVPFTLIFWGQQFIPSGLASILNATTPLFTILVAGFLFRAEAVRAHRVAGVIVGFIGAAVAIGPGTLRGLSSGVIGQLAVVGAAVSYAFAGVFGRRFKGLPPLATACGQLTCSTLILLVALPIWRGGSGNLGAPTAGVVAAVVVLALASTALAYVIYFRILTVAGPTNLLLVTLLIPVAAILPGAVFLGERITGGARIGMAIIGAGLLLVDGRPLAALRVGLRRGQDVRPDRES